ncbi:transcriptional regulator domain-containing protein [Rhizobium johnstonii]
MGGRMMPEQGKWRISTAYDYLEELDAPDLAWEFLRRNPEYKHDFEQLSDIQSVDGVLAEALSQKWGLSFRGRSRQSCVYSECPVVARRRSMDVDTPRPTGRPCACSGG